MQSDVNQSLLSAHKPVALYQLWRLESPHTFVCYPYVHRGKRLASILFAFGSSFFGLYQHHNDGMASVCVCVIAEQFYGHDGLPFLRHVAQQRYLYVT